MNQDDILLGDKNGELFQAALLNVYGDRVKNLHAHIKVDSDGDKLRFSIIPIEEE